MIEGVNIVELISHQDNRGYFREIFRFPQSFEGIPVGQISHSLVNEGVVKAWHGHVYQYQWNYVVSGQAHVVLYDNRPHCSTYKEKMEFNIGDTFLPKAYFFPPGVLHGYKCLKGPMNIIYITSGVYTIDEEIRIAEDGELICHTWRSI